MFSKCAFIKFLKIQSFVSLLLSDNVNCAWGSKTIFYKFIHTLPVVKHKIYNYGTITMVQFILLIHFYDVQIKSNNAELWTNLQYSLPCFVCSSVSRYIYFGIRYSLIKSNMVFLNEIFAWNQFTFTNLYTFYIICIL